MPCFLTTLTIQYVHRAMTSFASPEVVRCPACNALVKRMRLASVNFSDGLFPPAFQAMARGHVSCPCCGADVEAKSLKVIARLDESWKRWVWLRIPDLLPRTD